MHFSSVYVTVQLKVIKQKTEKKLLPVSELFQKKRSSIQSTYDMLEISRHLCQGNPFVTLV